MAEPVFVDMANEAKVKVFFQSRIRERTGVLKNGAAITSIFLENGDTVNAKLFCDASYDAELMA